MDQWGDATKRAIRLTQTQIAKLAIMENAKIMETPPIPLSMVRHVDGVEGAPEETVRPDGVIVYDYERIDLVAAFALDTLRELSPVDSGDYVRSHVLMLNGVVVDDLKAWKKGDTITISNTEPYTRKIEIGKKGFSARGHVYEKAERIVNRRFGNMADVFFTFREAPPGAIHEWAAQSAISHSGHATTTSRIKWLTRQPTLVIREL